MSDAGTLVTHFADGKLLQLCHQLVPVFLQCCYRLIGSTLRYKHAVETWKTWQTFWKYNLRSQKKESLNIIKNESNKGARPGPIFKLLRIHLYLFLPTFLLFRV